MKEEEQIIECPQCKKKYIGGQRETQHFSVLEFCSKDCEEEFIRNY